MAQIRSWSPIAEDQPPIFTRKVNWLVSTPSDGFKQSSLFGRSNFLAAGHDKAFHA
jgi:hypothetical protein